MRRKREIIVLCEWHGGFSRERGCLRTVCCHVDEGEADVERRNSLHDQINLSYVFFSLGLFFPQSPRPISSPHSLTDATSCSHAPAILFLRARAYVPEICRYMVFVHSRTGRMVQNPHRKCCGLHAPATKMAKTDLNCAWYHAPLLFTCFLPIKKKLAKDFNLTSSPSLPLFHTRTHARTHTHVLFLSLFLWLLIRTFQIRRTAVARWRRAATAERARYSRKRFGRPRVSCTPPAPGIISSKLQARIAERRHRRG